MTYHSHLSILVLCLLRHPRLPLFPYTTLFRSRFTGGAVVESDSPAEALHGRQASHLRLFGYTGFFVQRVAVSKRQEDRIAILVGGLFRVPASLNAFRGKERRLPHL